MRTLFTLAVIAFAPAIATAAPITIDFETDGNGNPINAPNVFSGTTRLTNEYSALGVTFQGPGGNDGGAILDEGGNFGVNALSGTQFLAFNQFSTLSDGGTPIDPQTILFSSPQENVSIFAASGFGAASFTLQAYDSMNNLLGSDVQASNGPFVQLSFADNNTGISRVVLTAANDNAFVLDDLTFEALEVEPEPVPEPASIAVWSLLLLTGVAVVWMRRRRAVPVLN